MHTFGPPTSDVRGNVLRTMYTVEGCEVDGGRKLLLVYLPCGLEDEEAGGGEGPKEWG